VLLLAERQLHRHRPGAEAVDHRLHGGEEVRAGAVHLVDEGDPRHAVAVGLRQTVSDCGSTPATESKTAIAPSRTRRLRSTSTVKSTCPGVSMMLIRKSRHSAVVAAEVIVMPALLLLRHPVHHRAPSWTSPILWVRPV
jgi:hypothetical protein